MQLRGLLLLALVASALLLAPVRADDAGDIDDDVKVKDTSDRRYGARFEFKAQGGELRLRDKDGVRIKVRLHRLSEVTPAGKVVATTRVRLADSSFSFTAPYNTTFPGTAYATVSTGFSGKLPVIKVSTGEDGSSNAALLGTTDFSCAIYKFSTDATVLNGADTVTVGAGDVKFTYALMNWPFQNTTNQLRLTLFTEVEGSNSDAKSNSDDKSFSKKGDGKRETSCNFPGGKGRLDLALSVVADGTNVPVSISNFKTDGNGGVAVYFPYFTKKLSYDPTVSLLAASSTGNSATTSVPTVATTLLLAAAAFLAKRF